MSNAIESGIGTLNYVKQTAKGTQGAAAGTGVGTNQPKLFDGELSAKKIYGQEEYTDGSRFGSPTIFTDKIGGAVGSPVVQVQPENGGLFYAQVLASDTVTGGADPFTHTITSAGTTGAWGTWYEKTGASVGPNKEVYWDSKIVKLVDECGQEQKTMHYSMDIAAMVAAQVYTVDPAKAQDTSDPLLWTEMTGTMSIDGTIITDVEGEVIEVDTGLEPWWGDGLPPGQLIEKKGMISRSVKSILTDQTLLKYYKALYNTTTPTAGNVPTKDVFFAAIDVLYTRSATRTLQKTTPKVALKPDDMAIGPQREGGKVPLELGGQCLKSGATPALTVVAKTADATAY
jgi:hypothetical protein